MVSNLVRSHTLFSFGMIFATRAPVKLKATLTAGISQNLANYRPNCFFAPTILFESPASDSSEVRSSLAGYANTMPNENSLSVLTKSAATYRS